MAYPLRAGLSLPDAAIVFDSSRPAMVRLHLHGLYVVVVCLPRRPAPLSWPRVAALGHPAGTA